MIIVTVYYSLDESAPARMDTGHCHDSKWGSPKRGLVMEAAREVQDAADDRAAGVRRGTIHRPHLGVPAGTHRTAAAREPRTRRGVRTAPARADGRRAAG